ncbi:MAG TPA: aldose 1-epimerase [Sphingomicrobium sp.]|nr:aldose 1-epimerase [Sphingomicrobium sp.]
MSPDPPLTLSAGALELAINPSIGGSISSLEWREGRARVPVLRKCNSCPQNVLEAASFPLVPYVNRIRGGRFAFRGREVKLAENMAGDASPLHGQGWLAPWRVERASGAEAALSFHHAAGEWPWEYRAEQRFALDSTGLWLSLECRNLADEPMPCGLGQHPYFHCGNNTRIDAGVTHAWTIDAQVLPVEQVAATGRFDLRDRAVCGQDLDHGFGGWNGRARLSDPDWPFDIAMSSPGARFFQLYSPASGGIFVAEPVTHANAALNAPEDRWGDLGMRVLEPGEAMSLAMRLEVTAK